MKTDLFAKVETPTKCMSFCFQILYRKEQITEIREREESGGKPMIPQLTAEAAPGKQSRRGSGRGRGGRDVQDGARGWGARCRESGPQGTPRPQPAVGRTRVGETPQGQGRERLPPRGDGRHCVPTRAGRKSSGYRGPWGSPKKGHAFGGACAHEAPKEAPSGPACLAGRGEPRITPQFLPRCGATSHGIQHHSKFSRPT